MSQEINRNAEKERFSQSEALGSGTSCIAWFKLAELISRKEKEKALNLFRLLSHSFENKAYVLQLEGDMLWSLEDVQAIEKYKQAAFLYKKEKKVVNSIAIYEHLLTLQPQSLEFLSTILILYVSISWQEKFEERFLNMLDLFDKKVFAQEQVLGSIKKIIDFATGNFENASNSFDVFSDFDGQDKVLREWVVKSIFSLVKDMGLGGNIRVYCEEKNLKI